MKFHMRMYVARIGLVMFQILFFNYLVIVVCLGNHPAVVRALGRRNFCAPSEEYAKRNYASNEAGYNTVISSLTAQRRFCPFIFLPVFAVLRFICAVV